jgi:hypothetical protein
MNKNSITWEFTGHTEASELGLAPGSFPPALKITLPTGKEVNLSLHVALKDDAGEVLEAIYFYNTEDPEGHNVKLTVFND